MGNLTSSLPTMCRDAEHCMRMCCDSMHARPSGGTTVLHAATTPCLTTAQQSAEKQMDSLAEAVRRNRSAEVAAAERREALADLHGGRTLRSGPYVSRSIGPERVLDPSLSLSAGPELSPASAAGGSVEYATGSTAPQGPQER